MIDAETMKDVQRAVKRMKASSTTAVRELGEAFERGMQALASLPEAEREAAMNEVLEIMGERT